MPFVLKIILIVEKRPVSIELEHVDWYADGDSVAETVCPTRIQFHAHSLRSDRFLNVG
jgi:hypothetical protein